MTVLWQFFKTFFWFKCKDAYDAYFKNKGTCKKIIKKGCKRFYILQLWLFVYQILQVIQVILKNYAHSYGVLMKKFKFQK